MEKKVRDLPNWFTLVIGTVILFTCGFMTSLMGIDYGPHEAIVSEIDFKHPLATFQAHPEPLWHSLTKIVMEVLHLRVEIAGGIVSGLCIAAVFWITYLAVRRAAPQVDGAVTAVLCFVLQISAAIFVPWFNARPYLGQGTPNVWHNPTTIMVRPIALLLFILVTSELKRCKDTDFESGLSVWRGILIAFLLFLSNLAKPSFVQIYYPAIFILMVIWLFVYQRKNLKLGLQLLLTCIPSLILMIAQFILSFYGSNEKSAGIQIAPFAVMKLHTDSWMISLLLVIAFPLIMCVIRLVHRKTDWGEGFGWILLAVGFLERALIAEGGDRYWHGNFSWGFMIGLALIWYEEMKNYIGYYYGEEPEGKKLSVGYIASSILLLMHFISGVYYLIYLVVLGNTI